jgi:DNA repair exonuclease SbcCD ATPase subunit
MRESSPSFDERYHQRYLFFKEQIRDMQRAKQKSGGSGEVKPDHPPQTPQLTSLKSPEREALEAQNRQKSQRNGLDGHKKQTGVPPTGPRIDRIPEKGSVATASNPSTSQMSVLRQIVEARRSGSPKIGSNATIKTDFQSKRSGKILPTFDKRAEEAGTPATLVSHLATGSLVDKVDQIYAIEGAIKEQKNTKSQILTDMFGLQQEKNRILAELQERQKQDAEKIAELEAGNAELIVRLTEMEAERQAEIEEAAFIQTELQLKLETAEKEMTARDKTIVGLEERLRKLEADKEAMAEVIKNFIAPKTQPKPIKKK